MKAVTGFVSSAWFWLVHMPFQLLCAVLKAVCVGWFNNIVGHGYKPRNDLLDQVYKDCVELPVGKGVRLPWADNGAPALDASGRLYAYVAIANKWFGLTEKMTGDGGDAKSSYRYYYGADMAGNWFAEIWSVWKSGFLAALLALPVVETAIAVNKGQAFGEHSGALLLMIGLLLVLFFLPRAIFGRGTHYTAISLVNGSAFGGYGCAQVINWCAGLAGISYLWLAFGVGWDFYALGELYYQRVTSVFVADAPKYAWSNSVSVWEQLYRTPAEVFILVCFGMAWAIIPAAFFWYVSLRFYGARLAKAQLEVTGYTADQASMYEGSDFARMAGTVAPQIALASIIYFIICVAFLLNPIATYFVGLIF